MCPPPLAIVMSAQTKPSSTVIPITHRSLCLRDWRHGLQKTHSDVEVKALGLAPAPLPLAATFGRSLSLS